MWLLEITVLGYFGTPIGDGSRNLWATLLGHEQFVMRDLAPGGSSEREVSAPYQCPEAEAELSIC
jgi:hypothetical protein